MHFFSINFAYKGNSKLSGNFLVIVADRLWLILVADLNFEGGLVSHLFNAISDEA
jgi:hypothetical protein